TRDGSELTFSARHTCDGSTRTDFFFLGERKYTQSRQSQDTGRGIPTVPAGPREWEALSMVFPSFDLTGQVALVTGAARGLGRAISLALAHAGADVAVGLRDVNAVGDLADQIGAMGRRALPLQMDVGRLDQIFQSVDNT